MEVARSDWWLEVGNDLVELEVCSRRFDETSWRSSGIAGCKCQGMTLLSTAFIVTALYMDTPAVWII